MKARKKANPHQFLKYDLENHAEFIVDALQEQTKQPQHVIDFVTTALAETKELINAKFINRVM